MLTRRDTGALATAGWGTALGVIREPRSRGRIEVVYADETRPPLQGPWLTAWELTTPKAVRALVAAPDPPKR